MTYQLSVNKTTIIVGAEGSSETITITSDDDWTVSVSETWIIDVSDTSGKGNKTISVTISLNSTTAARTGTITVKGSNSGISKTITIT